MRLPIDPRADFWASPEKRITFKEELEEGVSSEVMNALYLLHHPASEFKDFPLKLSSSIVSKDYIGVENFDFTPFKSTIAKIKATCMSKAQASLDAWEKKLEERDAFIDEQPYDFSTFEVLDKMMSQTSKLWDQYFAIRKKLEQDEGKVSGDIEESLSDKGIL